MARRTSGITTHWHVFLNMDGLGDIEGEIDDAQSLLGNSKGYWFGEVCGDASAAFYFSCRSDTLPLKLRYPECEITREVCSWNDKIDAIYGKIAWQKINLYLGDD